MLLSTEDIILRLVIITLLAAAIGAEREYHRRPAGIRTNAMVGLGATLMTLASVQTPALWPGMTPVDPGRIAAQIVVGIGFIGAGIILQRREGRVIGLTTAATLWVVAGLGIAVGMGLYREAIATATFVFFTFFVLTKVVVAVRKYAKKNPPKHDPDFELLVEE
jgi:putative Mg2+ transporter-C (MgtC) family protein